MIGRRIVYLGALAGCLVFYFCYQQWLSWLLLLAVVILGSLSLLLERYIYEEVYCTALRALCRVVLVVLVVTRLLSGVHWLTDILAGVFLGCCLVSLFDFVLETVGE